jgi:hypothetical protein
MNDIKVVNAIIKYARIDDGDRGLVTLVLTMGTQGIKALAGMPCIQVAGVSDWSKVVGKSIRVKRESGLNGKVIGIGHITKDIWFIPSEDFKKDES